VGWQRLLVHWSVPVLAACLNPIVFNFFAAFFQRWGYDIVVKSPLCKGKGVIPVVNYFSSHVMR
jgi:hypothetical protein